MFTQDRDQLRRFYLQSWEKARNGQPLEPLEREVVAVIEAHPEYHALLARGEAALGGEYPPELGQTNPFLHMGLHLALREQVGLDRPAGVRAVHTRLRLALGDAHAAEHAMMECLAEALWQAQREGRPPDEAAYLRCLQALGR